MAEWSADELDLGDISRYWPKAEKKVGSVPRRAESRSTQPLFAKQITPKPEVVISRQPSVAISADEVRRSSQPFVSISADVVRRSSRIEKTASEEEVKEKIPSCLQEFQKSDTSTRTFHFYGTGNTPKFAANVADIFACEGLHYGKKGKKEWVAIARYMEVSVKFRDSKKVVFYLHFCSLPQGLSSACLLVAARLEFCMFARCRKA